MSVTCIKDEFKLAIRPTKGKPSKKTGPFKLWSDSEGNIYAIAIVHCTEQLKEFRRNQGRIQMTAKSLLESGLVGMWKDRKDIGDSAEFARKLRERAQTRSRD